MPMVKQKVEDSWYVNKAKDADGKPLVKPAEFEDFMRFADADMITDAVAKMQQIDGDTFEDTEKKS